MISLNRIQQYKWFIVIGLILLISIFLILITLFLQRNNRNDQPRITGEPSTTLRQEPFRITATNPTNNAENVYAGEQVITLRTDVPVSSESNISVSFTPALSTPPKFTNTFPNRVITMQIIGGLQTNTQYTVRARDWQGSTVSTWSFRTSGESGEGDSGLQAEIDREINEDFYPLITYLPYSTPDYLLGYTDRKKLKITLKNQARSRDVILQEVRAWVRSKGIDPDSHEYVFVP